MGNADTGASGRHTEFVVIADGEHVGTVRDRKNANEGCLGGAVRSGGSFSGLALVAFEIAGEVDDERVELKV